MTKFTPSNKIYLAKSSIPSAKRGVFASVHIKKGEVIESCPVLVVTKDVPLLRKTLLRNYYFVWQKNKPRHKLATRVAVCFGFGSLYNHSYNPNAMYKKNLKQETIDFIALTDIKKGQEVTVNYNGDPTSTRTLWIKSIKPASA